MTLKPSEKRLLTAFGIVVFLIINFAAFTFWQEKEVKVASKKTSLTKELKRLEGLKSKVPIAREYEAALAQYLKRYDSLDTRDTYLTTFVQTAVDKLGLKLAKNAPLAGEQPSPDQPAKFIKSAYRAEVSGEWKKVLEFIYGLQEPTEFRYVKSLVLSTRKNEANDGVSDLVCDFTLQKWWNPQSDELLAEAAEAAGVELAPAAEPAAPKESEQKSPPAVGTSGAQPALGQPAPNVQ
jgi:hypothetical protein